MSISTNMLLAVFDLDGTLSRTDLFSVPAHKQIMADMGYPIKTDDEIRSTYGMVRCDYLKSLINDNSSPRAEIYLRRVADLEQQLIFTLGKPFDGTREMLVNLRDSGIRTAVCSNASYRYISMVLSAYGLTDVVDYIQPVSEGLSKIDTLGILLAHTGAQKAVMSGDTRLDMQAAQQNNIPFIGCMYGFQPHSLEQSEHKAYDIPELCRLIKEILL